MKSHYAANRTSWHSLAWIFASTIAISAISLAMTSGLMAGPNLAATPQAKAEEPLAAVTTSLAGSYRTYLELQPTHWDPDEEVTGRAVISPVSHVDLGAGRLKGHWEQMAKGLAGRPKGSSGYAALIAVSEESDQKIVWQSAYPIDPIPLAKASQDLVPDATLFSRLDPPAVLPVRIPGRSLKPGSTYRVTLSLRDPQGIEHRFPHGSTKDTAPAITIRSVRLDREKLQIPYRITDSPGHLTRLEEVANPGHRRFTKDDAGDCQARSIWDLKSFEGRIYLGMGDWAKNRGPIPLWSFGPDDPAVASRFGRFAFPAKGSPQLLFTQEYTVQEHAIDRFRVWGERLVVPGLDGYKEGGPDGIAFASVYIREKGHWRKLSTLPRVVHVEDVLGVGDRLYARVDRFGDHGPSVVASDDVGLSWSLVASGEGELVPFQGGALLLACTQAVTLSDKGKTTTYRGEFTPRNEPDRPHRPVPFADGVVYTTWDNFNRSRTRTHPLFFLTDLREGPRLVGPFRDKVVRDLLVIDKVLYVLASGTAESGAFDGEVYSTRDLKEWVRIAAFHAPATPNALASLGGSFYIGLANRGYDPARYDDLRPSEYVYADAAAGSILRLVR